MSHSSRTSLFAAALVATLATSCVDSSGREALFATESCMVCHNGANEDYLGPGLENPHPFPAAPSLKCVTCHGGNPLGDDKESSHVPPPPQIGDDDNLIRNRTAYFNRLTLAGIDKFADYTVDGQTYSAIDYLQFINPGDLRVVTQARACGACHSGHAECVAKGVLATEGGVFSGATYAIGVDNHITENQGLYEDTAADLAVRAITDPNFTFSAANVGPVGSLLEFPVYSRRVEGPRQIFRNEEYDSANLVDDIEANGQVKSDSPLADLFHEQVAFTCGDCHLGSAGANNRAGDFRSSGCTACHMPYSLGGRSGSLDPNVNKFEPADPDDVDAPETAHVRAHRIVSVRKTMSNGHEMEGIDDYACAGCHQGSNRTVMQYWGIRLDQNQDLRRGVQYPANPVKYTNTAKDTRLFDPVVKNRTFNGRNANQYILFEDYDGDDRDDTPADVHHEAGMGCIDCHGSYDLHGGDVNNPSSAPIMSRMEQSVAIRCETCHGAVDSYAPTQRGTAHNGEQADLAVDAKGNTLAHVVRESDGNYYLYSRLTGNRHYVKQTLDVVVDSGKTHPFTSLPLYSAKGSYAMGRDDGSATTGIGPQQTGGTGAGFSHMDNMTCASCHSSWTNTCMGCHLEGEYNTGNNFSNITGERIVFREKNADFVYQSPVPFQLGVGADNKIRQVCPNTKTFFQWEDRNNVDSQIFAFSDRNAGGANPSAVFPSLATNAMMAHSIRGRVTSDNEGPRYCVACHLTTEGMTNFGTEYSAFRTAIATNDFGNLNFTLLQSHIGRNPGNQLNSPLWVHMVAGLGSGLFLFDENGCPVNPLDSDDERVKCEGTAPADTFDPANVVYNLDRIVEPTGASTGSSNHAMLHPGVGTNLRDGAVNPNMAGPLGSTMIMRLIDPSGGIVLNSWIDADGGLRGDATTFVP